MMNQLKRIGKLFISGVEIGSVIYLLVLAAKVQSTAPTAKNILSIMIMAGFIGVFSGIFSLDDYRLELPIHFVVVFFMVVGMMAFNGWMEWQNLTYWLELFVEFVVLYALAYLMVFLSGNLKITLINKTLKERQKSQHK
ncbi:MAG: DUF3021 domain-containing protein [Lentilactobacillus parabuchneri]|nr:DUF3021 domain-containing protein [Lentilactobacillus parabuchneri]